MVVGKGTFEQCLSSASLEGLGWMFGGGSWWISLRGRLVRASKCVLRVAVANEGWMGADQECSP